VERVRKTALSIAKDISTSLSEIKIDLLVVELAAILHDILDKKYLKEAVSDPDAYFQPFFDSVSQHVNLSADGRAGLIVKIIENVSWTNEKKLRAIEGGWTEWHQSCIELHCVQDADRLDAIGGIGASAISSDTRRRSILTGEQES
jgi:uncharacterized protein